MHDYYVYVWKRPDTNEFLYVGYGTGPHRYQKPFHSKEFQLIFNDLKEKGFEPKNYIVTNNLSRNEARLLESYLIIKLIQEGQPLVNKYFNWKRETTKL